MSMCIIVVCPPGRMPESGTLLDCIEDNRDGSGFALRTPYGLVTRRSADEAGLVLDEFLTLRDQYPHAWAIWHSRIATHGTLTDDNTHPFQVPGKPWVLAHNGIMGLEDGPFDRRNRSDTRIMAEDIFSQVTWSDLLECKERVERWLGSDKVAIMSERKERGGPVLIYNEDKGRWASDDGCWYSRWMWKKSAAPVTSTAAKSSYWDKRDTVTADAAAGSVATSREVVTASAAMEADLETADAEWWAAHADADEWTASDCTTWCECYTPQGCGEGCPITDMTDSDLEALNRALDQDLDDLGDLSARWAAADAFALAESVGLLADLEPLADSQ